MLLNQISTSYRCHCAIGNSLNLQEMMHEVILTFITETDAIFGSFYLEDSAGFEIVTTMGKELDFSSHKVLIDSKANAITLHELNDEIVCLCYRLELGALLFVYDKSIDIEFISSMYESFRKKLEISISACLNVHALQKSNKRLQKLSHALQEEVDKAVLENKAKERQIFEQSKMAQMGELIGNIAHQWRQPLSIISTTASGMRLKKELSTLSEQEFFEYIETIGKHVSFLSDTIDEFRDYINDSHRLREVMIQERVKMALKMIEASYDMAGIKLIESHVHSQPVFFRLIAGKLLQVLISIFNNAREVLQETDQQEKWVKYSIFVNEYNATITIEDNGGGIDEAIIDKVFNPYFTTKHQSQGTGIGLYTSYDIITNHLGGRLYVKNSSHGAKFFIELPLNANYSI